MVSENIDYDALAQEVVNRDRYYSAVCNPEPEHVFIRWRDAVYKGSLQRFFEKRQEIVYMTKSSRPYGQRLVEAIRRIDPGRQDFEVPDNVDVSGTAYPMQTDGNRLLPLTEEQRMYFKEHSPAIVDIDINLGEVR